MSQPEIQDGKHPYLMLRYEPHQKGIIEGSKINGDKEKVQKVQKEI